MANRNLRPISVGDIFDEGFDLYKKNFLLLLLAGAMVFIPLQILGALISQGIAPQLDWLAAAIRQVATDVTHYDLIFGDFIPFLGSCVVVTVFCLVPYSIAILAIIRLAAARYLGEDLTIGQAYAELLNRIVPVTLTATLYIVLLFLCYISCIVPILIPLLAFPLVAFTLVLERKNFFKAFGRAWSLSRADIGRVFCCILLLILLAMVITFGWKYPIVYGLDIIIGLLPGHGGLNDNTSSGGTIRDTVLGQIGGGIALLLTTPFVVSVLTVFYFDLRVRREAFDVELLAKDLNYPDWDLNSGAYVPPAHQPPAVSRLRKPVRPPNPPPGGMA